jgi:hypothetical protein
MQEQSKSKRFWPNGARLAIRISFMIDVGGAAHLWRFLPDLFGDFFFVANHSERTNEGGKHDANTSK